MAKGFQGNVLVRRAGSPIEYTPEAVEQLLQCSQDPAYFVEHFVKIKNVDVEELILFKMRWYQRQMLEACTTTNRKVIIKLPRQAGKTSIIAAILLWHALFIKNYSILVVAHKADKARDIVGSIKEMYEHLPPWLQHGIVEWNKGNIVLENGSRIRASATSASSARGDTYNAIYCDEFAFVPLHIADEFIRSVIPTISSGITTKIFVTSTPKGLNMFYKMWTDAVQKRSDYVPIEIKWNDVPGRDDLWRKKIIIEFGQEYFDQEYGAEFIGSSRTLITASKLRSMTWLEPIETSEHFRVFAKPEPEHIYTITVDVAEGVGGDCSASIVTDVTEAPYKVVCVYQNRYISTMAYPNVLYNLGRKYNNAMVLIETNLNPQIAEILHYDLEYESVVWTQRKASTQRMSDGKGSRPGVFMDERVKRIGCINLKNLIESDQLVTNDFRILSELQRFVIKSTGKGYEAEEGNDDLVICLVHFGWLVDQGYIRELTSVSARAKIAEKYKEEIEREMMPLGFITDGSESTPGVIEGYLPATRANDIRWLFPELAAENKRESERPKRKNRKDDDWWISATASSAELRAFYEDRDLDDFD